jgi:hypothetical protein
MSVVADLQSDYGETFSSNTSKDFACSQNQTYFFVADVDADLL